MEKLLSEPSDVNDNNNANPTYNDDPIANDRNNYGD